MTAKHPGQPVAAAEEESKRTEVLLPHPNGFVVAGEASCKQQQRQQILVQAPKDWEGAYQHRVEEA